MPNKHMFSLLFSASEEPDVAPSRSKTTHHPCTTKAYKQWPLGYYGRLAKWLAYQGVQVLATGAETKDGKTIGERVKLDRRCILNLPDRVSITALAAPAQSTNIFIGNDTGPSHPTTGIQVFAISGPAHQKHWGQWGQCTHFYATASHALYCWHGAGSRDCRCTTTPTPATVRTRITEFL